MSNRIGPLGRLSTHVARQDWFAVGIELFVVVVGILIALQLDGWAQGRRDRQLERDYLERLKEDLQIERSRMDAAAGFAQARIDAARLLARLAEDPAAAAEIPSRVPWAVETASWRSFPQIGAFVYTELQSTGGLRLLRSEALRRNLAEHYTALQHDARVGTDLSAQHTFDAHTAGLLDITELEALEKATGNRDRLPTEPARARAIAEAFGRREAAVALLPSLVQHHTFNLRVIADMQRRADDLIRQIDELLAR